MPFYLINLILRAVLNILYKSIRQLLNIDRDEKLLISSVKFFITLLIMR